MDIMSFWRLKDAVYELHECLNEYDTATEDERAELVTCIRIYLRDIETISGGTQTGVIDECQRRPQMTRNGLLAFVLDRYDRAERAKARTYDNPWFDPPSWD